MDKKKMYALIILDGFGLNDKKEGNAIKLIGTPFVDELLSKYPHTQIGASGLDVGLPDGQMGNSEVGHLNMGAGRKVYQELTRISKEIADGDFDKNSELLTAIRNAKAAGKKLHVWGLLSDGGVHSHIEHLFALVKLAKKEGLDNVYIHAFLDGRDTPPKSGIEYIRQLEAFLKEEAFGKIATVSGRYYAMDRDNRWERVEKAYSAIACGEGNYAASAKEAVEDSYLQSVNDEFVLPTVIVEGEKPVATVENGDSVVFFNFRPDRAREITRAFIQKDFDSFQRKTGYLNPYYVGFTQYDASFKELGIHTAFLPQNLKNTLGEYLSKLGKTQLRIAETEKYAHVTFFFNGGVEAANPLEDRILVPSPKVATYDLQPEMSAPTVAEKAVAEIKSGKYDVMILNFANCDMVGHTGVLEAAEKAVKAVDECLRKVVTAILSEGGEVIVTADHGNADKMIADDGSPFTAHTTNPVPFIVVRDGDFELKEGGILADVAPTLLKMMDVAIPEEMTGHPLF